MYRPLKIFIIYARKDGEFKDELVYHLKPLKMLGLVDTWHDGDLQPGAEWDTEIKNQLRQADIIIPLVSTHFINSDYIQGTEFKEARERWELGNSEITPVIVRDCLWEQLISLADLNILPAAGGKKILPVNLWPDRDQAWTVVASDLKKLCVEVQERRYRVKKDNSPIHSGKKAVDASTHSRQTLPVFRRKSSTIWQQYRNIVMVGMGALVAALLIFILFLNKNKEKGQASPSGKALSEVQVAVIEPEMIFVQGGTFKMGCLPGYDANDCTGDEKPVHEVTLNDFYIGKYEVTQAQWKATTGIRFDHFRACDSCPADNLSWNDAQIFLKKLNEKTGKKYRLPTEAEWEYAARGGSKAKGYPWSGNENLEKVGWFSNNSNSQSHPVGQLRGNELGIYDMSGNVWEWCNDWYDSKYYTINAENNPKGPEKDTARVMRGGSWLWAFAHNRISNREGKNPDRRSGDYGLRVAMDAK